VGLLVLFVGVNLTIFLVPRGAKGSLYLVFGLYGSMPVKGSARVSLAFEGRWVLGRYERCWRDTRVG
jgi:hypothetical protein